MTPAFRKSDATLRGQIFIPAANPAYHRPRREIDKLKTGIEKMVGGKPVTVNVVEIKNPDMDAQLVAENIASQLERRSSFRRAMKQSIARTMRSGAKGIKVRCGGRLNGAEIARSETYHEGTIPLQTLRADIDYGQWEANTTYGKIGVKVWIYKGESLTAARPALLALLEERQPRRDRRDRDGDRRAEAAAEIAETATAEQGERSLKEVRQTLAAADGGRIQGNSAEDAARADVTSRTIVRRSRTDAPLRDPAYAIRTQLSLRMPNQLRPIARTSNKED